MQCDFCKLQLDGDYIDGKTIINGCWATMCEACHKKYGVGLGLGKGQKYNKHGEKISKTPKGKTI